MKNVIVSMFMVLGLLCAVKAFALPENVKSNEYSGSQSIKATPGTVYSFTVSYAGVTVGDKVQLLDGGASGTARLTCVAATANGTCPNQYTTGSLFTTDVYLKETKSGGTFFTDLQLF